MELSEWMAYFEVENEKIHKKAEPEADDLSAKIKAGLGGIPVKKKGKK